ncbi:plasmid pRiA4b ORF-3 family protein [Kiloniella sp.]|uniref:plasmid pRiA4b ORF-3 family protein n=1 Tax=Kiloniella sp. TaxID=1938587 RepID=UPI003B01BF87
MKTYSIKVALQGVSPMVWRRFRITGDTSLASLHYLIQIAQDWNDDYLHTFHIYGRNYGIYHDGGISFQDSAFQVKIDDFEFDVGDKFTYEYNFFAHWEHDIRIEAIEEQSPRKKTPFCLSGNGMQGATVCDVYDKTMELYQFLAESDETTTIGEALPYVEALNEVRFNRHEVNKGFAKLDLEKPSIDEFVIIG